MYIFKLGIALAYMYGLLTKCEVKMAGYWPSFFCVFMDQDEVEVHKLAKKERGQYPAILTIQASSYSHFLFAVKPTERSKADDGSATYKGCFILKRD